MPNTPARRLQILQHALGVNERGEGEQYRNYFLAGPYDANACRTLVAMGCMCQGKRAESGVYFHVTGLGRETMKRESEATHV